MPSIKIDGGRGLVQEAGSTMPLTLDDSNSVVKVAVVKNTTAFVRNSDSIVEWAQPANSMIMGIDLLCTSAPECGTGNDLGYEVGTSSSGAQIVATHADDIVDAADDDDALAKGGLVRLTMVRVTTDAVNLDADASYTASARTIYLNTTCTNAEAVATAGTVSWIIKYITFA
jgi:hypothetical protein